MIFAPLIFFAEIEYYSIKVFTEGFKVDVFIDYVEI